MRAVLARAIRIIKQLLRIKIRKGKRWAFEHRADQVEYNAYSGLNFWRLSTEEQLMFVELSTAEKQAFGAKKRQEAGK